MSIFAARITAHAWAHENFMSLQHPQVQESTQKRGEFWGANDTKNICLALAPKVEPGDWGFQTWASTNSLLLLVRTTLQQLAKTRLSNNKLVANLVRPFIFCESHWAWAFARCCWRCSATIYQMLSKSLSVNFCRTSASQLLFDLAIKDKIWPKRWLGKSCATNSAYLNVQR